MKPIGLIGGMSWESTAIYYRLLNEVVKERLGGLHSASLLLRSFDFAEIAALQAAGDWDSLTKRMIEAGRALREGGAEAVVICTNTMHKMAAEVEEGAGLPVLHIADATGNAIAQAGLRKVGLLATRFTMEQAFYKGRMHERYGIEAITPDEADRTEVHRVIYDELCRGIIRPESKREYLRIIESLIAKGAEGIILGCTEVCMLIAQPDVSVPVFDSTQLHVNAVVDWALA